MTALVSRADVAFLTPPSLNHWLGTDRLGRDVALRTLEALAVSLGAAVALAVLAILAGLAMALIFRHTGSRVVQIVIEALGEAARAQPVLVLALLFGTVGLPGAFALPFFFWVPVWRLVSADLERELAQPYVQTLRLVGVGRGRSILQYILPAVVPRLSAAAAALVADVLIALAILDFLGYGPRLERPSLGRLLGEAITLGAAAPWVWLPSATALAILSAVLAFLGRWFRRSRLWTPPL
jgi:ABC-type dipeptide/oligopeptide/nickel transport system permease subunit